MEWDGNRKGENPCPTWQAKHMHFFCTKIPLEPRHPFKCPYALVGRPQLYCIQKLVSKVLLLVIASAKNYFNLNYNKTKYYKFQYTYVESIYVRKRFCQNSFHRSTTKFTKFKCFWIIQKHCQPFQNLEVQGQTWCSQAY